jgi:hypothetical protein
MASHDRLPAGPFWSTVITASCMPSNARTAAIAASTSSALTTYSRVNPAAIQVDDFEPPAQRIGDSSRNMKIFVQITAVAVLLVVPGIGAADPWKDESGKAGMAQRLRLMKASSAAIGIVATQKESRVVTYRHRASVGRGIGALPLVSSRPTDVG